MTAMNQKPNEAGWFYHAPARKNENKEPVGVPPPSQIPGLGEIETPEPEQPREMVFRDTDTKYIRMAKMGGRKDLLTIRPNPETKKDPVSYPRNEWFYLEDNALEDKSKQEQEEWHFLLPEYMVHQPHGSTTIVNEPGAAIEGVPMRGAPYATEQQSQFNRDGHSMTDKTVKLPEARRQGYGVRTCKPPPKGPKAVDKTKPLSSQVQGERPRLKYQPLPSESEEKTDMVKLLSNTYEREWHDRVHKWQEKQGQSRDKSQVFVKNDAPVRSEYNNNYISTTSAGSQRSTRIISGASKTNKDSPKQKEEAKKEPFKMSKFKNVPARVDTHQSPEVLAAVST